ncbi:MAG: YceI family protein [Chloroflexi bacterium]|nr:YceI family protein [Chloroflexota bacterium]
MTPASPVQHSPGPRSARPSLVRLLVIAVLIVAAVGVAFGTWYFFLRTPPAPVSLGSTPTISPSAAVGASSQQVPSGTAVTGSPSAGAGALDGSWSVDPSVGSFSDFSSSFVGYRVKETLGDVGLNTAVGRTPDVTGTLTVAGASVVAVEMTADLTNLQSDDGRRDGQLRRQGIETQQFPTATFRLTSPISLAALPADGQAFTATAVGDFTLHGVTKSVEIPVEARRSGEVVTIVGSLPILFADYQIDKPRSPAVVSIEDNGIMEFQLHFTRD